MSLKLAAQHLSNQGRGPDDTLVHMSKNELKSLSDLANAHGGQLSINPDTGLPEAGMLDKLLPTIVGAGLTYFSGGAINPMTAGFITGGIETLRSGSLEKGLMAGLGAYGGAGLTGGLMGAGEASIGMGARDEAVRSAAGQNFGSEEARQAFYNDAIAPKMASASNYDKLSAGAGELFNNPSNVLGAVGGGFGAAKYAAGAAAPYLADALKPTTDMPDAGSMQKPTEYRQYKVKRRPDMSYEYTALPVSNTFTPNFADGGGVSDLVNPYLDPSFKFKNVGGPPKVSTSTEMPELKMAEGGRTTPEEFYQQYMQQGQNPTNLQYGARGYADTAPVIPTTPYERPSPTPADIVGVDGETYSWDINEGKYVAKPKIATPQTNMDVGMNVDNPRGGGDPSGQQQARINQFFDNMTPQQKADHQAQLAAINEGLTPIAVKVLQAIKNKILFKSEGESPAPVESMGTDPGPDGEPNGIVTVGPLTAADGGGAANNAAVNSSQGINAANAAAAIGAANAASNSGAAGTSAGPGGMAGITGAPGVAASVAAGNAGAAGAAGPGGSVGGVSPGAPGPSGMGGMGTGAHGAAVSAGVGVGGGGGSGGGGGGGGGNGSGASSAGGSSAGSAYSDVRMKDNIKSISNALGKVKKLDGITYDMSGKRNAGLSAQQVEKVLPEVVHKDSKGMRKLDYGNTVGLLVEAVKELDAKKKGKAAGGMIMPMATGGISDAQYNLGGYSDGGRLLRGPGDGVSDSIPATIGRKQPARLADGEFVIPARIVSEIGNGSTEAGARKLYAMMDRIQRARAQTVGKGRVAKNTRVEKYLPA